LCKRSRKNLLPRLAREMPAEENAEEETRKLRKAARKKGLRLIESFLAAQAPRLRHDH